MITLNEEEYIKKLEDLEYSMEDKMGRSKEEQATMCGFNYGMKYAIAVFKKMMEDGNGQAAGLQADTAED